MYHQLAGNTHLKQLLFVHHLNYIDNPIKENLVFLRSIILKDANTTIDNEIVGPSSLIRKGTNKEKIIDSQEITSSLPFAVGEALAFIEKNTAIESVIGKIHRQDIPEYPPFALREAVINAVYILTIL